MKKLSRFFILMFVFLVVNCSHQTKIMYEYHTGKNLYDFKTFSFMPIPANVNINQVVLTNGIEAVTTSLQSKGLKRHIENPDILIAIHTKRKDMLKLTDWGYSMDPHYWRGVQYHSTGSGYLQQLAEGTLFIDVVSTREKKLIWRGYASKVISADIPPSELGSLVKKTVAQILKNFPPKK